MDAMKKAVYFREEIVWKNVIRCKTFDFEAILLIMPFERGIYTKNSLHDENVILNTRNMGFFFGSGVRFFPETSKLKI